MKTFVIKMLATGIVSGTASRVNPVNGKVEQVAVSCIISASGRCWKKGSGNLIPLYGNGLSRRPVPMITGYG